MFGGMMLCPTHASVLCAMCEDYKRSSYQSHFILNKGEYVL